MEQLSVKFNGKEYPLAFGLDFLNSIDRKLGLEVSQASLGNGVNMLIPNLRSGNPLTIAYVVKFAIAHNKNAPNKAVQIDKIMDDLAVEYDYDLVALGKKIVDEMGKRPMIQALIRQTDKDEEAEALKEMEEAEQNQNFENHQEF